MAVSVSAAEHLVAVSIAPQEYLLRRIGGDIINVEVLVAPGQSPATYEITPRQMAELTNADLYFTIGVPFERTLSERLEKSLPDLKLVSCYCETAHQHDHEGDNDLDPHCWLDPDQLKQIALCMTEALRKQYPDKEGYFRDGYGIILRQLKKIDNEIKDLLASYKGQSFYVYHPAFGHFAERYGLRQVAIEQDGKEPSAKKLAELIRQAKADGVKYIFVQPQFAHKSAGTVAEEIGAELVELDPLAGDLFANLKVLAGKIAESFDTRGD